MIRVELHDKVSSILVDRRLLGDLRTTGPCYTVDGVVEAFDDPNPSFCVRHTPLDTFDVSNQQLSSNLAGAMVSVLEANPGVRYMNFNGSNIGERLDSLSPILACPKLRLYSLNLSFCKLAITGFENVVQALLHMVHPVEELSLVGNDLTGGDIATLAKWLETNTSMKLLDLGLNGKIGDAGLATLTQALSRAGHPLQTLGLSGIGLNDNSVDVLSSLVLDDKFKVEFLDISWNVLGVDSPGRVASILGQIRTVRELHAMAMKFGAQGGKLLFQGFVGNQKIEVLHLGSNYIPSSTGPYINECLAQCPNLKWIDFVSNLSDAANLLTTLQLGLSVPNPLTILSLGNINIGGGAPEPIGELIATSTSLLELHLNFNNLTDAAAFSIANALQTRNRTLQILRLDENEITAAGVEALLQALQSNRSLLYIDLSENDFDPVDYESIAFPEVAGRCIRWHSS